jgi:tetratricopeptide (TPR) repeat protein
VNIGRVEEGLARLRVVIASLATVADEATPEARRARFHTLAFAATAEPPARSREEWERLTARAASALSPRSAGRVYLSLSVYLHSLWRLDEAVAMHEVAITFARQASDSTTLLRALAFYAQALWALGRTPQAIVACAEARDTGQAVNDLEAVCLGTFNLGDIYRTRGAFDRARESYVAAIVAAERFGVPEFAIEAPCGLGLLAFYSGQWDETLSRLALARIAAHSFGITDLPNILGLESVLALATYRTADQRRAARRHLEQVVEQAEQYAEATLLSIVQTALAEEELIAGQAEPARERLRRLAALPGAESVEALTFIPLLAWAEADTGDLDRADALLAGCVARATAAEHRLALLDALRVRASLATRRGNWRDAADDLDQSLALARPMPYPYAVAKALYAYGLLEAAQGATEPARARYREALTILEPLGERPYAARIKHAMGHLD